MAELLLDLWEEWFDLNLQYFGTTKQRDKEKERRENGNRIGTMKQLPYKKQSDRIEYPKYLKVPGLTATRPSRYVEMSQMSLWLTRLPETS